MAKALAKSKIKTRNQPQNRAIRLVQPAWPNEILRIQKTHPGL